MAGAKRPKERDPSKSERADFEALVSEALEGLPADLSKAIENLQIIVLDFPDDETVKETGVARENLLGLYQGIPLTERDGSYSGVLPDRICLYQSNLEKASRGRRELKDAVRRTVIHEIAHHFGIDDDRLDELGWA